MKKNSIWMFVLLMLITTIVSCESLFMDETKLTDTVNSDFLRDEQNPEAKFWGTWIYSDKNYGQAANERGEDIPPDLKIEIAFIFRTDGTGTYSIKASNNDIVNEEQQEFIWYIDTSYDKRVYAVMRDNTAESYTLLYENELFLTMNTTDVGTMFFAKKQQGEIQQ